MFLKKALNWRLKILAKIMLARLPVPYSFWKHLGLFEHGAMDNPDYAHGVFLRHFNRAPNLKTGWVGLELGPGDSLAAGVIAVAYGAAKIYLIDVDRYASDDMNAYRILVDYLRDKGLSLPNNLDFSSLDRFLEQLNIVYLTDGNQSLADLSENIVDFCWSQAVLEHVRRDDFAPLLRHLKNIMKEDAIQSHRIDLQDHLDHSLNNLRFSENLWEGDLFATSGFYTNRLRFPEIMTLFQNEGFHPQTPVIDCWDSLPLTQNKMADPFRSMQDKDLLVRGFDLITGCI